mgnify:CR=1 FL=1
MLVKSDKSRVRRSAARASYQRSELYPIIDRLKMGHVCFVQDGAPVSIPMLVWRVEDSIYIHGSRGSRLVKQLLDSENACISFAELNGWVMAKSAFHHSANYHSAVLFGQFDEITDEASQLAIYGNFVEQLEEGRWPQIRKPNQQEINATSLLKMDINEGAVKIRKGGPVDDKEDLSLPVWAGELPLYTKNGVKIVHPA